jgi:hypothetical protein
MITMVRRGSAALLLCLAAVLAGCTAGSSSATVRGVAAPCLGIATTAQFDQTPVVVNLVHGHTIVSTETVDGKHSFSLSATPGAYKLVLEQDGLPLSASPLPPVHVTLHSGQVAHVDLIPSCK